MTKRELEKRVKDLQAEVDFLRTLITFKKDQVQEPVMIPATWPYRPTYIDSNMCTDGQFHDYPNPWLGTQPPACRKCGKQSFPNVTITSGTSTKFEGTIF